MVDSLTVPHDDENTSKCIDSVMTVVINAEEDGHLSRGNVRFKGATLAAGLAALG